MLRKLAPQLSFAEPLCSSFSLIAAFGIVAITYLNRSPNLSAFVAPPCLAELSDGTAERDSALAMIADHKGVGRVVTIGADKAYDTRTFVDDCRAIGIVPHVAQNEHPRHHSAIDARTTRHPGYSISQRIRKRVEEIFG